MVFLLLESFQENGPGYNSPASFAQTFGATSSSANSLSNSDSQNFRTQETGFGTSGSFGAQLSSETDAQSTFGGQQSQGFGQSTQGFGDQSSDLGSQSTFGGTQNFGGEASQGFGGQQSQGFGSQSDSNLQSTFGGSSGGFGAQTANELGSTQSLSNEFGSVPAAQFGSASGGSSLATSPSFSSGGGFSAGDTQFVPQQMIEIHEADSAFKTDYLPPNGAHSAHGSHGK